MRAIRFGLAMALFLLCLAPLNGQEGQGQENAKNAAPEIPIKVQVVLTEYDGNQRISSLPYMMEVLATAPHFEHRAFLRFGVRVPISTGTANNNLITYQDVGTNIDCHATQQGEGDYQVYLSIERSSVTIPGSNGKETEWKPGDMTPGPQPLIRSFRDELTLDLKNGQTIEGTSATDPATGRVLKVEVTLNVVK